MTLSSRHRFRNSSPGGLRPSTLPLGHRGSPQYWLSHVDGEETFFVSFKPPSPGTEPVLLEKIKTSRILPDLQYTDKSSFSTIIPTTAALLTIYSTKTVYSTHLFLTLCAVVFIMQGMAVIISCEKIETFFIFRAIWKNTFNDHSLDDCYIFSYHIQIKNKIFSRLLLYQTNIHF